MTQPTANPFARPTPRADGPSATDETALVLDMLRDQRDQYESLQGLAKQQSGLIENGSAEQLLAVLAQRQQLVTRLQAAARRLDPYRPRLQDLADAAEPDQRQQLRDLVAQVQQLLGDIMAQDDVDRQKLQAARETVGAASRRTAAAGVALGAYGKSPVPRGTPRFTDARG
jgi:hypothetical protein